MRDMVSYETNIDHDMVDCETDYQPSSFHLISNQR